MTGREVFRRCIHVALGGGAFLVPMMTWPTLAIACGSFVVFNAFILPRLPVARQLLRQGVDSGHRGLVLYPLVLLGITLISRDHHEPVQAAWLALSVGDGLAPLLGMVLTAPRWPHRSDKSVSASVMAFVLAGLVIATALPLKMSVLSAAGGLVGEAIPGEDNLTIPVLAALGAYLGGMA